MKAKQRGLDTADLASGMQGLTLGMQAAVIWVPPAKWEADSERSVGPPVRGEESTEAARLAAERSPEPSGSTHVCSSCGSNACRQEHHTQRMQYPPLTSSQEQGPAALPYQPVDAEERRQQAEQLEAGC